MVRDAVQAHIDYWLPTYLNGVAIAAGEDGPFPAFNSYVTSPSGMEKFAEDQLPACIIKVPATVGIEKHGSKYRITWAVGVAAVVSSSEGRERTLRLAELYGMAVTACIMQKQGLNAGTDTPFASGVQWEHMETQDVEPPGGTRTIAGCVLAFGVDVDSVLDVSQGPLQPIVPPDVATGWTIVTDPSLELDPQPVTVPVEVP
jgi:hypothetical protein